LTAILQQSLGNAFEMARFAQMIIESRTSPATVTQPISGESITPGLHELSVLFTA
jgi:hypothetical protein